MVALSPNILTGLLLRLYERWSENGRGRASKGEMRGVGPCSFACCYRDAKGRYVHSCSTACIRSSDSRVVPRRPRFGGLVRVLVATEAAKGRCDAGTSLYNLCLHPVMLTGRSEQVSRLFRPFPLLRPLFLVCPLRTSSPTPTHAPSYCSYPCSTCSTNALRRLQSSTGRRLRFPATFIFLRNSSSTRLHDTRRVHSASAVSAYEGARSSSGCSAFLLALCPSQAAFTKVRGEGKPHEKLCTSAVMLQSIYETMLGNA
jgi:hypothetical protein